LFGALLIVQRHVEIEFQIVFRLPLRRTREILGLILEIIQILIEELDAHEGEGLGAQTARVRSDDRIAVDARAEGGDVLLGVAEAADQAELTEVRVPALANRARIARRQGIRQVAVFSLGAEGEQGILQVQRADGPQIDGAAHRTFDRLGFRHLDDLHGADHRGRQIVEADARPARARPHRRDAVDFDPVGIRAANLHAAPDARLAGDLDAGDVLKHFGEILVRQLADVLGLDDLDQVGGVALLRQGVLQRRTNAGDDDLIDLSDVDVPRLVLIRLNALGERRSGRHQRRRRQQYRRKSFAGIRSNASIPHLPHRVPPSAFFYYPNAGLALPVCQPLFGPQWINL